MSLVPRRTLLVGGALSALGALGACSSSGDASTDATAAASSDQAAATVPTQMEEGMGSGAADGVFPRTVVHYQGETTINAAPAKVVALDKWFDGNDALKSNTVLQMKDAGIVFECV